jgi:hypothetical protein
VTDSEDLRKGRNLMRRPGRLAVPGPGREFPVGEGNAGTEKAFVVNFRRLMELHKASAVRRGRGAPRAHFTRSELARQERPGREVRGSLGLNDLKGPGSESGWLQSVSIHMILVSLPRANFTHRNEDSTRGEPMNFPIPTT